MLLITMGTQPIQCDRIIKTILNANIKEKIIIQSPYIPTIEEKKRKNINFFTTIPYLKMNKYLSEASIVVVSGTGGILRALLANKKVIIFPRLGKYKEAADDHGLEMKILKNEGYCEFVEDEKDFLQIYKDCNSKTYKKFISNSDNFINKLQMSIKEL